ncbi:MAG TPA: DUF2723 domain-containing protein [Candidatus Acidoferrales bacterium]|nr:DUF2723 domain-containing protein [Candidatus Acidoferrales bacterium]
MPKVDLRSTLLTSAALALLFAVWYARLTATDVQFGDGPELTLAAATNGVAHPPGYPLWIVLAHAFTLLPFGTIPFRVGLFSALCHALTVGFVCAGGILLTRNLFAGLFAGTVLGATPLFVTWSLQPEVFPLNDLLTAAITLCVLLLITQTGRWWLFVVSCALLGLGLANQQTIVAFLPLLLYVLWYKRWELPPRAQRFTIGLLAVASLLLGFLVPYAHTLLASQRALPWPYQTAHNLGQLFALITRKEFGAGNLVPSAALQGGTFADRLRVTAVALWPLWPVVVLGAILTDNMKLRLWIPAIWGAAVAIAFAAVANINVQSDLLASVFMRFMLQPLVMLAPWAALALSGCLRLLQKRPRLASIAGGTLCAIVLVAGLASAQTLSLRGRHDVRTFVNDVFATVPHGATLLVWDDLYFGTIPYFQNVEGLRPDVTFVVIPLLFHHATPDYAAMLEQRGLALDDVADTTSGVDARDALARANPSRTLYVGGWGPITDPAAYAVAKMGLTGVLSKHASAPELAALYRRSAAVMSAPGYGEVTIDPATTRGWGIALAGQYGMAFFSMGNYAKSIGDKAAAHAWYTRALHFMPDDPTIKSALQSLP